MFSLKQFSCFFLFFYSTVALAQQPYNINYSVNNGLPSSESYSVIQDSKGYVWVSGDAGIARFNGYNFTVFTTENGLTDNTVFQLTEAPNGSIWCSTLSGKLCFYRNNRFYTIGANDTLAKIKAGSNITNLVFDDKGVLYLSLEIPKIIRINPPYRKNDLTVFDCGIPGTSHLFRAGSKNLFCQRGKLPSRYTSTLVVHHNGRSPNKKIKIKANVITKIHETRYGITWLSCGNILYKLIKNDLVDSVVLKNPVTAIKEDFNRHLWVGTLEDGVYFFKNGALNNPRHYFANESVSSLCEDHEHGIWMASLKNGLYYMPQPAVIHYKNQGNLNDNKIHGIAKTRGKVVAGKTNGYLLVIDPFSHRMEEHSTTTADFSTNIINNLVCENNSDSLIVLAHNSFVYDIFSKKANYFKSRNFPVYLKWFKKICSDKWFSGTPNGLFFFHHNEFHPYKSWSFMAARINAVAVNNGIWLATTKGLFRLNDSVPVCMGDSLPFLKNRMDDIEIIDDGLFILATKANGLLLWNKKTGSTETITMREGLASNTCKDIYIENDSLMWISTNKGVNRFNYKTKKVLYTYSVKNGLPSNEANRTLVADGQVWIATSHGLCSFALDEKFKNQARPFIYLHTILLNDKPVNENKLQGLSYSENKIEFRFEGLTYKIPGTITYQYRLKETDKWQTTTQPYVRFQALEPGIYTFEVRALNDSRLASALPAVVKFTILKPVWLTAWFMIMAILLVSGLVVIIFVVRIKKIRKKEQEKAHMQKKMLESEMTALRAQMNPHFIFNAMNSIQHFILTNNNDAAHKHLLKFSKLIRNVLENSKNDLVTLQTELETLKMYMEIEALRFTDEVDYRFMVDEKLDLNTALIPPMLLQPYVENAIWHGLLPKEGAKTLTIELTLQGASVIAVIDDNGLGRNATFAMKNRPLNKKSLGMEITSERLETLNYIYKTGISVSVMDKTDDFNHSQGTRVELRIPMIKKGTT
ncbi:MAG TPA: histidine kinase [Flavobacteriales bacterium]|nr:histidine kinase [Flavobacteriales bacterium]